MKKFADIQNKFSGGNKCLLEKVSSYKQSFKVPLYAHFQTSFMSHFHVKIKVHFL